ncbi:hypothetical protein TD95_002785 [Thielaviopsis punctulata]|uniref:TPX2 C-terminal domain-containing protein n=1 Tax=Thielaviopsis punctulata TaxID=72032 RepID=A0A0F4ZG67_9PEZI|nr:hypothetical protein TD95_002785 [Thielaviopsis punctulata]
MESVSANSRDPFRFSVLVEIEDDDESISTNSSRCGSALNHRKFASSFNSSISFGSSCSTTTTVPSYESSRPASPNIDSQLERHTGGQYQAVLAVPVHDKSHLIHRIADDNSVVLTHADNDELFTLIYGISLLKDTTKTSEKDSRKTLTDNADGHNGQDPSFANIINIVATRLERHDDILKRHPDIFDRMAQEPSTYPYAQVFSIPVEHEDQPPPYAETAPSHINTMSNTNNHSHSQLMPESPSRPTSALSRIEDSVEALDILEEEIEALDVQFNRVMTPSQEEAAVDRTPVNVSTPKRGMKRAVSTRDKFQTTGRMKTAPTTPQQKPRRSSSLVLGKAQRESLATDSEEQAVKRSSVIVARPTSLLPPKPLARSSKPLTTPSFELPGVAVGRRLKEQREARLAAQAAAAQPAAAPAAPSLPRSKTTKRLIIPNYELPGDAISRRKRQEAEERLRKKEEEERKAREFKARPIPASIYGGSSHQPRENVSSRLRQGKGSDDHGSMRETSKRASVLPAQGRSTPNSVTPDNSVTSTPRGRNLRQKASTEHGLRGTSSSTLGQRSSVSAEEVVVQRLRGRDLLNQDREILRIREEERKAREQAVKAAREEALERSRQASREWAEKQRRRQSRIKASIST